MHWVRKYLRWIQNITIVDKNTFFLIKIQRGFMQLLMYPACFMTQKLDKISFRTRNHGSKVTPSDIIVLRVFFSFSFFNRLGTSMHNVFAWKWVKSNAIANTIQHATGDVICWCKIMYLKIQNRILLRGQTFTMIPLPSY